MLRQSARRPSRQWLPRAMIPLMKLIITPGRVEHTACGASGDDVALASVDVKLCVLSLLARRFWRRSGRRGLWRFGGRLWRGFRVCGLWARCA